MNEHYDPNFYDSRCENEYIGRLQTTGVAGEDLKAMDCLTLREDGKVYKISSAEESLYGVAVAGSDISGRLEFKKGDAVTVCLDLHGLLCKIEGENKVGAALGVSVANARIAAGNFDIPLNLIIGRLKKKASETKAVIYRALAVNV